MDLLVGHLDAWIASRLSFVPPKPFDDVERRRLVWQALDVESETVEVLAEVLQLHYVGGRLEVTDRMAGDGDLSDTIRTALLSVFKFRKFSDSRWLTVGTSCRTVVASVLCGLNDLVDEIKDDRTASKYYLNGYFRMANNPLGRQFVVTCAFVGRAIEGVLANIIEGPRVARNFDELWELQCEDTMWLLQFPDDAWDIVAVAMGMEGAQLRSSVISRAHIAFHFVYRRVFSCAGKLPWSLCRGDLGG